MPTDQRRARARRRAWGRGPMILRFEPLETRELLSTAGTDTPTATTARPDLVGQSFQAPADLNWGSAFQAQGVVVNHGDAATTKPFHVDVYASPTPIVNANANAVLLGQATIPSGLKPGAQSAYTVPLVLPSIPLNGLLTSGSFYVAAVIDPQNVVPESNETNNADTGAGFDYQLVTPVPVRSASLVGTGLTASPSETDWGGAFSLSQQITNIGTADAPETRALVVLTPAGGATDVTIGSISIPAIAAGQSVTVNPSITLPKLPPNAFVGVTQYTLSVVQDADYATNAIYPHAASQGRGLDQAALTITTPGYVNTNAGALPDVGVTAVAVDSQRIQWGQSFQVAATLDNTGNVDPGPFRVRYLLVGSDGSIGNSLFLADSTVNGLAPGSPQNIVTTLKLPPTVPAGMTVNAPGLARVAVVVDPENSLNGSRTQPVGVSNLIQLKVVGTDGTTTPAPTITPKATTAVTKAATPKKTAVTPKPAKAPKRPNVQKSTLHVIEHNLKIFPEQVKKFFQRTFKI